MLKKFSSKLKTLLNHTSLWIQLAALTILVTTCIILLLIYNNFTSIRNQAIYGQINLSTKLLEMESENLDHYLMDLANFCIQPYYDTEFTHIINQKAPLSPAQLSYARQQMYYYYYTRSDLLEYELYLINQDTSVGRTLSQQHFIVQPAPAFDVEKAIRKCSESNMHHYVEPAQSPAFFTYYHSLFQIKGKVQQSIVRLKVNTSYLKQFLNNHSANNELFVLASADGELLSSNHPEILCDSSGIQKALSTRTRRSGYDTVRIGSEDYLLIQAVSSGAGLRLYCFTPLSYIDSQFQDIQIRIVLLGLLIWASAVSILYLLLRLLTAPLKQLSDRMLKTGDGDFQSSFHAAGSAEVAELSDSFNSMVSQIDDLINRTYVAELSEKNAQITALEAQINPHFLYNTLQAISTEALVNDQLQIHKMITALASNLRYTIKDGTLIPLKREMEYVTNYIFLQKIRRDETLRFTKNIEPDTLEYLVPKISIYTLVENSILHGFDAGTRQLDILVNVRQEGGRILIQVRDNGCGISKSRLEEIRQGFLKQTDTDSKDSIGLPNLYVRLRLLYEEPATMQIFSQEGRYTEILLDLPAIKEVSHV